MKWVDLAKEHAALATNVKKVLKLEADVVMLQKAISKLRIAHQAKIEGSFVSYMPLASVSFARGPRQF